MFDYDVCVIGGGILGCMAARNLMRYDLRVVLLEKREDVCTGVTRTNSAVIYAGYDNRPGTLKSELCVRGNREFENLCRELDVEIQNCGSLMVCFGERGAKVLRKKYEQGIANGVPGLRMLSGEEILKMEPNMNRKVYQGLYAPTTAVVNPWKLGIAAWENATENGCETFFNTEVCGIQCLEKGFELQLHRGCEDFKITSKGILNCGGIWADTIREMVFSPSVRIYPTAADFCVFDTDVKGHIRHVIFYEPEEKGKGLTIVPTEEGNILLGASEAGDCSREHSETTEEGLDFLREGCKKILPDLSLDLIIRSFGGVRPNPYEVLTDEKGNYRQSSKGIHSFVIDQEKSCPAMVSLIGIKTPGLTCCDVLTRYCVDLLLKGIGEDVEKREEFWPYRKSSVKVNSLELEERQRLALLNPAYGKIVCHCRMVTEGEILDSIHRGAVTVDGVKRRCDAGMGQCQGGRCTQRIMELLSEQLHVPVEKINKDGNNSWIIKGEMRNGTL